jgi:hypothetical protein
MIPLFCQSKSTQHVTSEAIGAGVREIPAADANAFFGEGERLFVSEPDGSEAEFLGRIQEIATDVITVELATQAAKGAGAKLWTPEAVFDWPVGDDVHSTRERQSGVEVVRSLGGAAYATRLRTACVSETVRFENLTDERFAALLDWIEQRSEDGLEEFTYVDVARVVRRVRLAVPSLEWHRNARDLTVADMGYFFLAESSYI